VKACNLKEARRLYFKWTAAVLVIFLRWVDDMLVCGKEAFVLPVKKEEFMTNLEYDDKGELNEYVGCKEVDHDKGREALNEVYATVNATKF
jgi:hypothetical protein